MEIKIAFTDLIWSWLPALNQFLDGMFFGLGMVLVFLVFVVFVNKTGKEK